MACVPWRSPPPDLYKLKPVLGYKNHDVTKKKSPAWSFVRYVPLPKSKPVVSMSLFQKKMMIKVRRTMHKQHRNRRFNQDNFTSDLRVRTKLNARQRRMHNKTNNTASGYLERTRLSANQKPAEAILLKDKAKKPASRMSVESGKFIVKPGDMCDLCFPWAKKKDKIDDSQDTKSKKSKRSLSLSQLDEPSEHGRHSFITIPMGHPGDEICEPHSGIILPSGRLIAAKQALPKLPLTPRDDGEILEKYFPRAKLTAKA